jgi:hypothetical protein
MIFFSQAHLVDKDLILNTVICYFYPLLAEPLKYSLSNVYFISSWHRNPKFLNNFMEGKFKVVSTLFTTSRFSWNEHSLCSEAIFNLLAMLTMCSIINGTTGQKLYTNIQLQVNTKGICNLKTSYIKFKKLIKPVTDMSCIYYFWHAM